MTVIDRNPTKCNYNAPHTGTLEIQHQLLSRIAGTTNGGLYVCKEIKGSSTLSFHSIWQAGDVMVPSQTAETPQGLAVVGILMKYSTELDIQRIIHGKKTWDPKRGWHAYTGSDPHWNHVHWEVNHFGAARSAAQVAKIFGGKTINPAPSKGTLADIASMIASARTKVLKKGSKGKEVQVLQLILRGHGHNVTIDGDFGPATDAAVRAFQKLHKLTVDGVVGPTTWATLIGH
jgi:murein L,D-transpeptidase YcbB/YkuD